MAEPPATEPLGARDDAAFADVRDQLTEYFAGERTAFDLAFRASGNPLQLAVWELISAIPYGATRSYGELARDLGDRTPGPGGRHRLRTQPASRSSCPATAWWGRTAASWGSAADCPANGSCSTSSSARSGCSRGGAEERRVSTVSSVDWVVKGRRLATGRALIR